MELLPLQQYQEPKYPVRQVLDEHPELLRLVPKRWQRNPAVLTALASLVVLMAGCGKHATSRVAPVFVYGNGVGSFGCESVNPPVYLSEDDARQVIIDEGKRAGIDLSSTGTILENVKVTYYRQKQDAPTVKSEHPLKLDGQDKKHHIGYVFISLDDAMSLEVPSRISVYNRNTLADAKMIRGQIVKARPSGTYAVFYEPFTKTSMPDRLAGLDFHAIREQAEKKAMPTDREQLRKQVQDFIKWLKSEGVI